MVRFFDLAARECGDRTWGLSLALDARLAAIIGPLWILLRNARTVGQMCEAFASNFDVFSDSAVITAQRQEGGLLLSWQLTAAGGESGVQILEFSLAVFANEIRMHTGRDWMPEAAMFSHPRPAGSLKLHRSLFGPGLCFNQAHNALLLDRRTVDTPLRGRDTTARALASRVVDLEARAPEKSIERRVEAVIRGLIPYAPWSLRDVSQALGIAPRSLQIRLKQRDSSFVDIRDAVRADLAAKYLRDSDLTAMRIAEILGYGDPTSLSRSFRRWHGKSIREVRGNKQ